LERYGPKGDGGYILCKNLLNIADIIYSYGINDEDAIGCELSNKLNIDIYQYDCFSKNPGCHKNAYFKNECVGNKKELRDNKKSEKINT